MHDKFPFICFRWSCIAAELKLPRFDTNGMKAQRKARVSLRKKKRQRAKNKRLSKKGRGKSVESTIAVSDEQPVKKDSLKYQFAALKEDRYIIISFNKTEPAKTDSVFVRYNSDEDDVLDYDKQLLKNYLDSNGVDKINLIRIYEHAGDKEEDKKMNRHASTVKERVAQYFVKLGIVREKIKTISK